MSCTLFYLWINRHLSARWWRELLELAGARLFTIAETDDLNRFMASSKVLGEETVKGGGEQGRDEAEK